MICPVCHILTSFGHFVIKLRIKLSQIFMQIEISQSRQFKFSIVYVVNVAISYNCFTTIMQHFVAKKCFYFKTPDGAASISSPSYWSEQLFYGGLVCVPARGVPAI